MTEHNLPAARFVPASETEVQRVPGQVHFYHCKPGMVQNTDLICIRVHLQPRQCHSFHHHPNMEEIIYMIGGKAEQWIETKKRTLQAGDSAYIPPGVVH